MIGSVVSWAAKVSSTNSAEDRGQFFGVGGRQVAAQESPGRRLKAISIQDQAKRGKEGKLKANIPEHERIEGGHEGAHERQRVQAHLPAPDLHGEEGKRAHERGAHDGRVRADEEGIERNAEHGSQRAAARAEQAAEDQHKDAGDDGNIEAGDGNDMRGAGILERLLQRPRQTGVNAQQNTRQQEASGSRNSR